MSDPHHSHLLVNVNDNNNIEVLDVRENKSKFLIPNAHNL